MDSDVTDDINWDTPVLYESHPGRHRNRIILLWSILSVIAIGLLVIFGSLAYSRQSMSPPSRFFVLKLGNLHGNPSEIGTFTFRTHPEWAPIGVDRFHVSIMDYLQKHLGFINVLLYCIVSTQLPYDNQDLVASDFFNDCRFFRVIPGFVAQFGINGDPSTEEEWRTKPLRDDPVVGTNRRGTISFATAGNNTRTTQLFINLDDNIDLDTQGFAPIGEIISGMDVVEYINSKWRQIPDQKKIIHDGNQYLLDNFPDLTYIISITPTLQ